MFRTKIQTFKRRRSGFFGNRNLQFFSLLFLFFGLFLSVFSIHQTSTAQNSAPQTVQQTPFRVGERLTYNFLLKNSAMPLMPKFTLSRTAN
jgi:hypothetical protein